MTFEESIQRLRAERVEREGAVLAALNSGTVEFSHNRMTHHFVAVTPSCCGEGLRFTRFDEDGISGHMEARDKEALVREIVGEGFWSPAPGAMDRLQTLWI